MKYKYLLSLIGLVVVLLAMVVFSPPSFAGRPINQWSPVERISIYKYGGKPPVMVADQNRTIHAFLRYPLAGGEEEAIYYNQWTLDGGWTTPNDVLLGPLGPPRLLDAFLDEAGIIHVVFFSGDELNANIYYSSAPALNADHAQAWSKPVSIGPKAIPPEQGALVGNNNGQLFLVYSGTGDGNGLYEVHSDDSGATWSDPTSIFLTYSNELKAVALEMYIDRQNKIHIVWSVVGDSGRSEAVYYANLEPGQLVWSDPIELAQAIEFEADTPNIVEYNGELIVIYHNGFPTTRWMRRSDDGGRTWTPPIRTFEHHVGSNGPVSFAIDNGGTLRAFFGNRTGNPAIFGMWYSTWLGTRWTAPEAIISGPRVMGKEGGDGFDPSFASAIVSQGNVIMVSWGTDPGAGPNGPWYSYINLDVPELPVQPLPTLVVTPTATPFLTPTPLFQPTATPTPRPVFKDNLDNNTTVGISNPATPVIVGTVPIILILATVVVQQLYFRSR